MSENAPQKTIAEYRFKITATLDGEFHVGGGKGVDANASYIIRDDKQRAYLPGSALKGKLRHIAAQLQEVCNGKVHHEADADCSCDVCVLFGAPGNARGKLSIEPLVSQSIGYTSTELRVGNQVDRMRRTVEDNKLFTVEAASEESCGTLSGEIVGYDLNEQQIMLLRESLNQLEWIGGSTSRGLGHVRLDHSISITEVSTPKTEADYEHVRVHVRLTPETPLFIGKQTRQGNFRDTLDYIPGEVVRAGLAAAISTACGKQHHSNVNWVTPPQDENDKQYASMRKVFGEIHFSSFRPFDALPYPFTAMKGKYCEHVLDTLAYRLNGETKAVYCSKAGCAEERTDYLRGWRSCKTSAYMSLNTRSAINSKLGVARDEALFSQQVLVPFGEKGTELYYSGWIEGNFDKRELCQLLESPMMRIGAMQSIGYGKVKGSTEPGKIDDIYQLDLRIKEFNKIIKMQGITYVPVLLLSNVIIDPPKIDCGNVLALMQSMYPNFKWVKVYAKAQRWRGVDTSLRPANANYFKESKLLLEAGSVFVCEFTQLTEDDLKDLLNLEMSHQFGMELRVADEFHTKEAYVK